MMVKTKTSIYLDKELWEKFKAYASKNGVEITKMLEEAIREEMAEDFIEQALTEAGGLETCEIEFEPVKPEGSLVGELVRVMRDERGNSIS
jgi:predicted transcriptional regulator